MNWQHLTYFKTTAEVQNFTRAAEQLYVTPSALSKAVHNLENELGFPLFEKQGRNVRLTRYGKTFYEYVVKANTDLEDGLARVQQELGLRTGKIFLSAIYTMCAEYLPPRIKDFKKLYPDVTVSFEYAITSKILEKVLRGDSDLGFCGDYELDSAEFADIAHRLIRVEELVMIASKDHWLAREKYADLKKMKNESFIIYKNVNSGISYNFWPMFKRVGFTPQIGFEVSDDHSILGLVASGLGVALVADNPSMRHEGIVMRRFRENPPTRNQYMIWRKDAFAPPAVQAFQELVLRSVTENDLTAARLKK